MRDLVLASGSPRRIELLRTMGVRFLAASADVDEQETGLPEDVVMRLAERKARAVLQQYPLHPVLAADTLVQAGEEVLGKPHDREDAFRMLRRLSGQEHLVHSGVCLLWQGQCTVRHEVTKVRFVPLSDQDIWAYIDAGEPFGKAGAYAVQGMGGMFVSSIQGSPSNVIGLPMHLVRELLHSSGLFH